MRTIHRRRPGSIVAVAATMVWMAATASAAPSPADDARVLRGEAVAALNAGDRGKAVVYLTGAARLAPDPGLWLMVGDMNASLGRGGAALSAWRAGLDEAPERADLLDRLARMNAQLGDWSAAATAQARLVKSLKSDAAASPTAQRVDMLVGRQISVEESYRVHLSRLSSLAALAGDFTTAEASARALVAEVPESVDGHLALGYVFLQAGEYAPAADAYTQALARDPDNPIALNNLGTIAYMQRDQKGAGARFEAVLGSQARTPYAESIALANLAELHQLGARYEDAEYLYDQAISAFPRGAWSYMGRAALLDLTGRYDAALDAMIDGWERDGDRLTRLNMHFFQPEWGWQRDALIAEIEGRWDDAAALWRKVAEGDVAALRISAEHHLHSIELMAGH